jgi:hypothetical protein
VKERERRVEAEREAGEPRFRLEQRVEIVEDRAGRVDRRAGAAGKRRRALAEALPLERDARLSLEVLGMPGYSSNQPAYA